MIFSANKCNHHWHKHRLRNRYQLGWWHFVNNQWQKQVFFLRFLILSNFTINSLEIFYHILGFADNPFSLEPTSSTSNSVFLINGFESHVCAVQVEETNSNKIVCLTP